MQHVNMIKYNLFSNKVDIDYIPIFNMFGELLLKGVARERNHNRIIKIYRLLSYLE